ncbi:DNA-binding bromodomain-containing protein [Euphorbia peplus]|nr:DNA-binding bromodomain-containing protein [Euphorbia peplus]
MKRKRAAQKKSAKKSTTPSVNLDEQAFIKFVANSVVDQVNNVANKDLIYSSSPSSSSSIGSFQLHFDSSGPDDPPAKNTVESSKKKRSLSRHNNGTSSVMPPRREFTSPKILSCQHPSYNKLELKTALAVIKKVMTMDETGPFNAPVDPVSQGLPDYFSVIDTPMDFGTICSNLQNGVKYMNSDDVYKDVNYIWENCRNYNKKGDYIVYLMKRVKKKFMNYWESAGLRTEILREHSGHSHSMPSGHHAMWQSRHEALSVVNRMVNNSNRMQHDKLGTSQPQPQVALSGNVQPYQSRQPQPSTTQVHLSSHLHAGEGSSYTDMSRSRARETGGGNRRGRESGGMSTPKTTGGGNTLGRDPWGKTTRNSSVRAGMIVGASMADGAGPSAPTFLSPSYSQTSQGVHTPPPSPPIRQLPAMFRHTQQIAPIEPEVEAEPEPEPEPEAEPAEDEVGNSVLGGCTELTLSGDVILPSEKSSRTIRKIFEKKLDVEGAKWKMVSQETKEFYFQEFKKNFFWDQAIDPLVKHAWHKKAALRYSDLLSETRRKGVRPAFIPEGVWKRWLELWSDPSYVRISQQNKLNRRKGEDGPAGPVHTGGSVPHLEHRKRLAEQLGRDPTPHELFVYTHTRKHDGQSFVDQRAKEVHERAELIREQMAQKSSTVDESKVFLEAAGGKRRSRVYGLGSEGPEYYNSHKSCKVPIFAPKNQSAELQEQLKQLQEQQHATEERHEERYNMLLETIQKQTQIISAMQQKIETAPLTAPADVPPVMSAKRTLMKSKPNLRSRK